MATVSSFFTNFLSFILLLFHLSCFTITTTADHHHHHHRQLNKRRLFSLLSKPSLKPQKAFSSSWLFFKKLFNNKSSSSKSQTHHLSSITPPRSSSHSVVSLVFQTKPADLPYKNNSDIFSGDHHFFPLRNDIFPCTTCGEIFHKPQTLDHHQAVKHAVSELREGDTGKNIVQIIFKTGWTDKLRSPTIHRILKIHNSTKILARFEEHREIVKSKAMRNGAVRCMADGNELLRFHCSTFLCEFGVNGSSEICGHQYCSVCGIVKSGFSAKLDGISTLSSSSRAHLAIPEEVEEEFKFMGVKRAMLVCRVVAGRVGCDSEEEDDVDKDGGGFDSVVGRSGSGTQIRVDEEELLVFNPRAVLPCFVIVYTV